MTVNVWTETIWVWTETIWVGTETFWVWTETIWVGTDSFRVGTESKRVGTDSSRVGTEDKRVDPGNTLVGLDIGANMGGGVAGRSFQYTNVEFNDGNGFLSVPGANALYNGVPNTNNNFALSGTLGDFTLRGQAQFLSGSVTSDAMRFFVNGRQAVPEPATMATLGLSALALVRRRRMKS
jgi:hypothetical protein